MTKAARAIAPFVSTPIVSHSRLALLSVRDTGTYPFVLQRFSEPVGVISAIPEQPVDPWQAAQQRLRADVIADLPRGHE